MTVWLLDEKGRTITGTRQECADDAMFVVWPPVPLETTVSAVRYRVGTIVRVKECSQPVHFEPGSWMRLRARYGGRLVSIST